MIRTALLVTMAMLVLMLPGCISSRGYVAAPHAGWQTRSLPPQSDLEYQVYLIGDTGKALPAPNDPVLRLLKARIGESGDRAAVVFLGDNVYCCGLRDSTNLADRQQDEKRLLAQVQAVEDFPGRVVFIPGNHDWNRARIGGLQAVRRQERFIENALGRDDVFLPGDGFPGPVEVRLTDRITLIAIDTEWWLTDYAKSYGDAGDYDLEENADFLTQLDDVIKRNDGHDLLVVGHHALMSNGQHSGILPVSDHIFPLKRLHPALMIPLPIVGSVYPLYVRYLGGRQDMANPGYKSLRYSLRHLFSQHADLIYASGHDHSLQYFEDRSVRDYPFHQIVSGAGSEPERVGRGRGAAFTYGDLGFAQLNYYRDGSVWMDMWGAENDGATGRLLFRTEVKGPAPELVDPGIPVVVETPDFRDSTIVMAANPKYRAGRVKEVFLGSHHRDTWATPVEAPVLDLGTEAGGLTPLKKGGGHQTYSLRLQGADGHQYVLRSINKNPAGTLPPALQKTIALDIVDDQFTLIQPYGALIIPRLADAVGVYHTNPKLVYVPHDPRLGVYQNTFSGELAILEERPDDDESDVSSFGGSNKVVGSSKMYYEINNDNDHRVDQRAYARARLLDMLISDWDRHADQWRWAMFEPFEIWPSLQGDARTKGKVYRPIPRDRDFAFNKMNGLFPSLSKYIDIRHQDFSESYGDLKGLNLSPRAQDRRLLNSLERSDWIEIADSMRVALTDEVINASVRDWPQAIYDVDGKETARLLKIRRNQLTDVARRFYELHATIVDVVGSNKHERFEVTHVDDGSIRIVVYKTSKKGEILREIYRRTILNKETTEIRLYGLRGNDTFIVLGDVRNDILVRAIGGAGKDTFEDHIRTQVAEVHPHFYDTTTGNTWDVGRAVRTTRSDDDPEVNYYNPFEYRYNKILPLTNFRFSSTNGFWLGGGIDIIRHGFRKTPYATSHKIHAEYATKTSAATIAYENRHVSVLGSWDVVLDATYFSPNTVRNFHGLGNETKNVRSREFYQARLSQFHLGTSLYKRIESGVTLRIGPRFVSTKVRREDDRIIGHAQAGVSDKVFSSQWFAGISAELILEGKDNSVNPMMGFNWISSAELNVGVKNSSQKFSSISSNLAVYISPSLSPQLTIAVRIGATHNAGEFPFYNATTLGRQSGLRGFRKQRFSGRTSVYQNVDLRVELVTFSTFLAMGRAGLLGFFDNGRVWSEADDTFGGSRIWHQGYGGGIWLEMFNKFVLTSTIGFSDDDQTVTLKGGFQY